MIKSLLIAHLLLMCFCCCVIENQTGGLWCFIDSDCNKHVVKRPEYFISKRKVTDPTMQMGMNVNVVLGKVNGKPIVIDDVWLFPGAPEEIVLSWGLTCEDKKTFYTYCDQDDDVFQRIALRKSFTGMGDLVLFDQSRRNRLEYINFHKPYVWKSRHRTHIEGSISQPHYDKTGSKVGTSPFLMNVMAGKDARIRLIERLHKDYGHIGYAALLNALRHESIITGCQADNEDFLSDITPADLGQCKFCATGK